MRYKILNDMDKSIFKSYDIRGVVGKELTLDAAYTIGFAFGEKAKEKGIGAVIVGRDGRLSSASLSSAVIQGILNSGLNVHDIGLVTTPMMYFATCTMEDSNTGIMVTGSHNPKEYNGIKMVLDGVTSSTDEVLGLYEHITKIKTKENIPSADIFRKSISDEYINYVLANVALNKNRKQINLVIDCGNGVGGLVAKKIYTGLGCKVYELYGDVDGNFPNHHPDPTIPKNLTSIISKIKEVNADLGLAFDGDADRVIFFRTPGYNLL